VLLLRVCAILGVPLPAWPFPSLSVPSADGPRLAYAFLLDWFASAAEMDSPVVVTRTESLGIVGSPLAGPSRDGSLPLNSFFHGPGESLVRSGDGRGVTSPMADIMGLATLELAADDEPKNPARALVLKLGVLDTGLRLEAEVWCRRFKFRFVGRPADKFAVLLRLSVRTGGAGFICVSTLRGEASAGKLSADILCWWSWASFARDCGSSFCLSAVLRLLPRLRFGDPPDKGGDGAIVLDRNCIWFLGNEGVELPEMSRRV
jgi:hypothetical protein